MKDRWVMMAGDPVLRRAQCGHRAPEGIPDSAACQRSPVKRVLVTGGAGFIGANLVRGLLADGLSVRVLDSLRKGDAGVRPLYANPDFELIHGDLRRPEAVVRAVRGVDAVIHLGALAAADCRRDPAAAVEVNVAATSMLTDVCRGMDVSRLVYASSLEVYGRRGRAIDETSAPAPVTLFAATKLDAERTVLAAADGNFHPVAFRLADVFGAETHADFASGLNRLVARAWQSGVAPKRAGVRPLYRVHVSDVCAVLRQSLVAHPEAIGGEVFHVGCERMRFSETAAIGLLAEAAPELRIVWPEVERAAALGPVISFQKLRRRMGVTCRGALRQGLAELLQVLQRGQFGPARGRSSGSDRLPVADLAVSRFLAGGAAG